MVSYQKSYYFHDILFFKLYFYFPTYKFFIYKGCKNASLNYFTAKSEILATILTS